MQIELDDQQIESLRWGVSKLMDCIRAHPEEFGRERLAHMVFLTQIHEVIDAELANGKQRINLCHGP